MLRALSLRDFVIVEHSEIHFDTGFTVFSGETGAGKSILIDALSLALGARTDTALIRDGAKKSDVSAVFDTPSGLQDWLMQHDLEAEGNLVLRRVIDTQGKSRAYINGIPVTLTQLRELGEQLVDIHGQHAHQSLLKPASQRDLLDAQGGHMSLAAKVAQAWHTWQNLNRQLSDARNRIDTLNEERDRLEWQVQELDQLNLGEGEWQSLTTEQNRLAHAQALIESATRAMDALDGEEGSAHRALRTAAQQLQNMLRHDRQLESICETIESARIATAEAASDLNSYLNNLELDPEQLHLTETRMSAVFEVARKFRVEPEEIPELAKTLRSKLAATHGNLNIDALTAKANAAQKDYDRHAAELSEARQKAGNAMAQAVTQAMQTLAMSGGQFQVALSTCPAGPHGIDHIEFLVAGHAGSQPRPLTKVASGGELARLSLALSVIASQAARVPTLIFDEVDSGVGGAVAEVVGQLLQSLGQRHQVLCVTHLPQVAACGHHHFKVSKRQENQVTTSSIEKLNPQGRVEEVARMLGGLNITDTTRKHAAEMLGI